MKNMYRHFSHICIILGILFFGIRMLGFFLHDIPYGYDMGFYIHALEQSQIALQNTSLSGVESWIRSMHEPLFLMIGPIISFLGFSVRGFSEFFPVVLSFGIGTAIFIFLRSISNKKIAAFWFLLASISLVQYEMFWWGYGRQMLGVIFGLLAFAAFFQKKYIPAGIFLIALCGFHRVSGVFFILIILLYEIFSFIKKPGKRILFSGITFFLAGIFCLGLYIYHSEMLSLDFSALSNAPLTSGGKSGTFLASRDFFLYEIFFIGICGILIWKEKIPRPILTGIGIGILWTALRLFFYNRFFIFLDVFLICGTAYGLQIFSTKKERIFLFLGTIFQIWFFLWYLGGRFSFFPIYEDEFEYIKKIPTLIPKGSRILITHKYYTPYIIGYSGQKWIAPQFGRVFWSDQEWEDFYASENKCTLLKNIPDPKPTHLWVGTKQPKFFQKWESCFTRITDPTQPYGLYEIDLSFDISHK